MAERLYDDNGVTCFIDRVGNLGAVDRDGNWMGFDPSFADPLTCKPVYDPIGMTESEW